MIQNDHELTVTQERITYFLDLLAPLPRAAARGIGPGDERIPSRGGADAARGTRLSHPTGDARRKGWLIRQCRTIKDWSPRSRTSNPCSRSPVAPPRSVAHG